MSDDFVVRFLKFACEAAKADRGIALNADTDVQALIGVSQEDLDDATFYELAMTQMRRALDTHQTVLGNNIITDPELAPKTNTALSNLRFVVTLPVKRYGVIYLDRLVRVGGPITSKQLDGVEGVLASITPEEVPTITVEEMLARYHQLV